MYDKLARFYDLTHADLQEDIPYILNLAAETDGTILELGCGSGRLLRPLARAGHQVTGVDNAAAMLALARQKLAAEPAVVRGRVQLVAQPMESLTLPDRFGLGLISYNTLLHLPPSPRRETLRRVRGVLGQNGSLFIDVANPFWLAALPPTTPLTLENEWPDPAADGFVRQYARQRLDAARQVLHVTWRYDVVDAAGEPRDRVEVAVAFHYLYPHELELLLRQNRFRLVRLQGDYAGAPFTEEGDRLLVLAEAVE